MVEDARFEDSVDEPVALRALDADDIKVISALVQDAVFPITEAKWDRKRHRFAILLNRFRWEQRGQTPSAERVQSVIVIQDVQTVVSRGVDPAERDLVLSLLAVEWTPGEDGSGRLEMVLAGDGTIAVDVEALEVTLKDVTRPYGAPSGKVPGHPA